MRHQAILGIGLFLIMCGCATPYQKKDPSFFALSEVGFEDKKIQEGVYRISFSGDSGTSSTVTVDYALLRAAEVALENGYKYFIIIESTQDTKLSSYTTPVQANTYGTVSPYGGYTANTYVTGGQTYISKSPSANMTIKCFIDKPEEQNSVVIYAAEEVRANLKAQYKIK